MADDDKIRELENQMEDMEERLNLEIRELEIKEKNERGELDKKIKQLETKMRERDRISEALLFGERITGTTSGSAGTATDHSHTLGRKPTMVFITEKSDGTVYLTNKSASNITVKGSAASLGFTAYLLI